jgi:hypothetical protein
MYAFKNLLSFMNQRQAINRSFDVTIRDFVFFISDKLRKQTWFMHCCPFDVKHAKVLKIKM